MKSTVAGLAIATLLTMSVTTALGAQELERGTWTGRMSTLAPPHGVPSVAVTFEVGGTDGALSIVMSVPPVGQSISFNEVALSGDELTFWWEPGPRVDCTLLRKQDGSFEGTCAEGSGAAGEGVLTMVPPSGEDRS